jgi:TatD DNase family protein
MRFIDTHCHLYLKEFENDLGDVLRRAKEAGVEKFYFPAIDSSEINAMTRVADKYPEQCFCMAGLHPCSVKENYLQELDIVKKQLTTGKFAAIGEIGLDFYWSTEFSHEQYEAFNLQMELALEYKMPIVIHTRNAMQQTLECVKPFASKGLRGIFHCFGDSFAIAEQITNMNFLMGIGGVLTYKKSGLDEVIKNISLEHIVLETDAPYLTPVPFRGKRNESSYIQIIAEKLSAIKTVSLEEVAEITSMKAQKIFAF